MKCPVSKKKALSPIDVSLSAPKDRSLKADKIYNHLPSRSKYRKVKWNRRTHWPKGQRQWEGILTPALKLQMENTQSIWRQLSHFQIGFRIYLSALSRYFKINESSWTDRTRSSHIRVMMSRNLSVPEPEKCPMSFLKSPPATTASSFSNKKTCSTRANKSFT